MNKTLVLVGLVALGLVAVTGLATAASGTVVMDANETDGGFGLADGASHAHQAQNASNSPWVTGDERLDYMQERFNLTDEQVSAIQTEVQSLVEENATHDEIRLTVTEMLESYGVEDPTLGPPVEMGPGAGHGLMGSASEAGQGNGYGQSGGSGPHGPADGSCMT